MSLKGTKRLYCPGAAFDVNVRDSTAFGPWKIDIDFDWTAMKPL
jgi:hypothetical protein